MNQPRTECRTNRAGHHAWHGSRSRARVVQLALLVPALCTLHLLCAAAPAMAVTPGMSIIERPAAAPPALPDGLEQWFELAPPPAGRGDQPLRLELALVSSLDAALAGTGRARHLLLHDGGVRVRFGKLLVEDATGRRLPAELELGRELDADRLAYVIDDRGAVYPLTIDPIFVQQAYLKASNTGAFDAFGASVALGGDTLVVGAPFEDSSATGVDGNQNDDSAGDSGAAYVFDLATFTVGGTVSGLAGAGLA